MLQITSALALDLIRVVECVDGCRPQIGSKQELMGSTLQVGSVHCFSFHLYDITVSYTVIYIYLQTQVSKTYNFGHRFNNSVSGYKHTKQSYPSFVLYISNGFISLHFCGFLCISESV